MEATTAPLLEFVPRRPRLRWFAAAAVAAAALGALIALGTWPPFATVMSGSMSPTIDTGDVVVLKRLDGMPRIGDVVAVSVPDEARSRYGYPPVVVHRVVAISPTGRITTKGDAKSQPDPFTVSGRSARSRVVFTIPAAGRVVAFLTSAMGLVWLALGAILLVGMPLYERQRAARDAEQEALAGLHEELRIVSAQLAALRANVADPHPVPAAPPQPHAPPVARRRSGGLVSAVARYARR